MNEHPKPEASGRVNLPGTARLFANALLIGLLSVMLIACSGATRTRDLNQTLAGYANVIRWMDIENALTFIDPEGREEALPSELELSRWEQFRVSGYRESPVQMITDSKAQQTVEISLTNRHTMGEKVIRDRQTWEWDSEAKKWWLTSGLPDISGGR